MEMLRQAWADDAEAIEEVRVAAWKVAYTNFMPAEFLSRLHPSHHVDSLREKLSFQTASYRVFVAQQGERVVGFFTLGQPRYEATADVLELWALYVSPEHWRKGIGGRLLEKTVHVASSMGCKRLELWCLQGNQPAQLAYEKAGFRLSGAERTSSKLTGLPLHEVHYTKRLYQVGELEAADDGAGHQGASIYVCHEGNCAESH
jgi:GNAT superfamily N-acetyltransferase